MKKVLCFALFIGLAIAPSAAMGAPSKPTGVCKSKGTTVNFGNKKFTCIKAGKKLVWNKGTAIKSPSKPSAEAIKKLPPLEAISDFKVAWRSASVDLTWSAPASIQGVKYFEIGLAPLLSAELEKSSGASYSSPQFFKVAQQSPINLTVQELRNFMLDKGVAVEGQAVLLSVRTVTDLQPSPWSRGTYLTLKSFDEILSRTPAATGTTPNTTDPSQNQTPAQSTQNKVYSTKRLTGFNSLSCPGGSQYIAGGLGTIPQPEWYDRLGKPNDSVAVYSATASYTLGTFYGRGTAIRYLSQNTGSYLAPNGLRYFEFARGSWNVPIWITCGGYF